MTKPKYLLFILMLVSIALPWGIEQPAAQVTQLVVDSNPASPGYGYYIPDYFTTPNWANSPPMRKFVDTLPGLTSAGVNNLGQFIPVAVPNTTTYPGSDYYEIALVQYRERMHSDLPALSNPAAKANPATTGGTLLRGYVQEVGGVAIGQPQYLGPLIIAQKDRPVRIKFTNRLPVGTAGNLFLPVDTTIMGAGAYAIDYNPITKQPMALTPGTFTQNRGTLHLHGGKTPWISDGTPHQWITPAGETTTYSKGISVSNVPDMPDPGPGAQTFYYTNNQSARLMFYHDHAYGITRLNVYAGEAAGYLIQDTFEQALVTAGTIPADQIPLIIQDKTFVDANAARATYVLKTDPTWAWGSRPGKPATTTPVTGDLWWPHVYMPAQNPFDITGANAFGRWHYGPWFFPATPVCGSSPLAVPPLCIANGTIPNIYAGQPGQPPEMPSTPNPSWGAEAFLDTMLVNGTAYPKATLQAKPYRLRILNACHDRFLNLQLYKASPIVSALTLGNPGDGYYFYDPAVTITGGGGTGATATAIADLDPASPTWGQILEITLDTVGSGYTSVPTVTIDPPLSGTTATATAAIYTTLTEVGMIPSNVDNREGGIPDPTRKGPAFVQFGTEGGFLPAPTVLPNRPVAWNLDPTTFNFGNVLQQNAGGGTLFLGPAERADVIVDLSLYAGQTLILYNDAPTAFPALVPQYDYYTGAPDRGDIGGSAPVLPGFGPNIRTIMQITVAGSGGTAPPDYFNPAAFTALRTALTTGGGFKTAQDPIIVGQSAYNANYGTTFPSTYPNWGVSRISDNALSFTTVNPDGTLTPVSNYPMKPKAIHDEMGATFDDYGRMSAKLGLEVPFTNAAIANFVLQNYVDPSTEIVNPNEVQIWKITHNGVDSHPIHFHLFDVQLINRVGWDGFIRLPDGNELGWKDTVRISPLEDTIVALRPKVPPVPFGLPQSIRPLNPIMPLGSTEAFSQVDTTTGGALATPTTNQFVNFGHEYVWHCHILSHEENDMMRAVKLNVPVANPGSPSPLNAVRVGSQVNLTWADATPAATSVNNPANEIGFRIERALNNGAFAFLANGPANTTAYTDATATSLATTYRYRVTAYNAAGNSTSNTATIAATQTTPAAPSNLAASLLNATTARLTWTDNSANETGFQIQRATNNTFTANVQTFTAGANATTFDNTGLAANTTYFYHVRATNASGNSAYSNTASVSTAVAQGPAAPSNLRLSANFGTTIIIAWNDNSNNEQGFYVERAVGAAGAFTRIATVGAGTTTYRNNFVAPGTYRYRVQSFNASGVSTYSNILTVVK